MFTTHNKTNVNTTKEYNKLITKYYEWLHQQKQYNESNKSTIKRNGSEHNIGVKLWEVYNTTSIIEHPTPIT